MPKACYIHIPFCKSRCYYCSFLSFVKTDLIIGYVYSLLKEISENYRDEKLATLYLGGGTPSLLTSDLLYKIIKKFKFANNAEITIEVNPDDCNFDYLRALRDIGFNRLSIGAQTFDENILKLIGRRHGAKQISETVYGAKEAGFENISLDLIYGFPTQNLETIKSDIEKILGFNIQHISTYGLKIEENSVWGKHCPPNVPDEDLQADIYELINSKLSDYGYFRYEVSNFAKKGYESKHNLTYWNNLEYYGFGAGAHGYVDGVRYSNSSSLENYLENPAVHEIGKMISQQEKLEEEIFLGFRKTEGINTRKINEEYGIDFETKYKSVLDKYKDYIIKTQDGYALNLKGTLLSNIILSEFIEL